MIHFKTKLLKIGSWTIVCLPKSASLKLPSRGMVAVKATIDGINFEDDKVVFIEFKTGNSNLSNKQKRIKNLVENKKVEWKTIDSKHL